MTTSYPPRPERVKKAARQILSLLQDERRRHPTIGLSVVDLGPSIALVVNKLPVLMIAIRESEEVCFQVTDVFASKQYVAVSGLVKDGDSDPSHTTMVRDPDDAVDAVEHRLESVIRVLNDNKV